MRNTSMIVGAAMMLVTSVPALAQVAITLDRTECVPGEAVTVTVALPGATTLTSPRAAWVSEGAPMPALDATDWRKLSSLASGRQFLIPAPTATGRHSLLLLDGNRLVARASCQVAAAGARSATRPRAPAVMPVALTGMLRMIEPRELVLGEEFRVAVSLPAAPPEQADRVRYSLHWTSVLDRPGLTERTAQNRNAIQVSGLIAGVDGMSPWGAPLNSKPASQTVAALAPWEVPGKAELRLYRSGTDADEGLAFGTVLDVLTVNVVVGRVANGIVLDKAVYPPGTGIVATLNLPPNRFYSGTYGPYLELRPIEVGGRKLGEAEMLAWRQRCGNCTVSLTGLMAREGRNRHGSGRLMAPGRYVINDALAAEGKVDRVLKAPDAPGRYEVRLYDRHCQSCLGEQAREFERHGYYFAVAEFVVEATGSSPTALRFVRQGDASGTPLKELSHGQVFVIEAKFDLPQGAKTPLERTVTLEWTSGGERHTHPVTVRQVKDGLYRSEPITLTRPAE